MKFKKSLVVVGSVAFDSVVSPFGRVKRALGGSAVFFSLAARFFCKIKMVGVVGTDYPREALNRMERLGIGVQGIHVQKGKTFHWKGHYGTNLNEAITDKTQLNVFADFQPVLSADERNTPYLFLANIDPKLQMSVLNQMVSPRWVACDTMNLWIKIARKELLQVIRRVDICLMNEGEVKELSGHGNLLAAARWVMNHGPKVLCVKLGEFGVVAFRGNKLWSLPAFLLDTVKDPTGAGDSFAGAFLGYLTRYDRLSDDRIREAMTMGSVVASYNVESFSIERLLKLNRADIQKHVNEFRARCV